MKKLLIAASFTAVALASPANAGEKKTYVMVNEDVGVPVFPYDIKDRPYEVIGEVTAGVRKATAFSKSPSQAKIYRELWERAEKLGAVAVINASYGNAHVTAFSWGKANAKGTAIRFKAAPAAASVPVATSKALLAILVAAAVQAGATASQPAAASLVEPPVALAPAPQPAGTLTLPKNTMVRLMVLSEVNSRDHQPGHRFRLRVDEDVVVGGTKLLPIGATAYGEVTSAEGTGSVGKSGRIGARLLYVDVGGRKIALTGDRQTAGSGGTGQAVAGLVALGIFGLFMKGNNASIKAGEIINGYTVDDVTFEQAAAPAR